MRFDRELLHFRLAVRYVAIYMFGGRIYDHKRSVPAHGRAYDNDITFTVYNIYTTQYPLVIVVVVAQTARH